MKVSDAMTRDVHLATPKQSIRDVARIMAQIDSGVLPVEDKDRLVGVITDRDIAVRAVAEGKGPTTKVKDVMSQEVLYCYDDQDLDEVARNMGEVKVRSRNRAASTRKTIELARDYCCGLPSGRPLFFRRDADPSRGFGK